jgi:hypothetical protein
MLTHTIGFIYDINIPDIYVTHSVGSVGQVVCTCYEGLRRRFPFPIKVSVR